MDVTTAKQEVRRRWRDIIPYFAVPARNRVNSEMSYVCPLCGHGSNGDGLTYNPQSQDGNGLKCFGCGFSGDVIDLIQQSSGAADFMTALKEAADYIGITIDENTQRRSTAAEDFSGVADAAPESYQTFFLQAQQANNGDYLAGRGISKETQNLFGVGYAADWKHPKAPRHVEGKPYVIFPTSDRTYSARYAGTEDIGDYKKMHVGQNAPFFCENAAFNSNSPIFIVEGETDALSLWEIGRPAVALGSVSNAGRFVEKAAKHRDRLYIIALDNDGAGAAAVKKLAEGFNKNGVRYAVSDISGKYKDPNERLQNDRDGLSKAARLASLELSDPEQFKKEKLNEHNVSAQLADFWTEVQFTKNYRPIPTGFTALDIALDGGIFPEQLLIMGAISSLGKTTFLLQAMDRIAAAGWPVMLFSLEMSRNEIIAKSLSRYTAEIAIREQTGTRNAKSARGILAGYRYSQYSPSEMDLMNRASVEYHQGAGQHLYIYQGNGDTGVQEIIRDVKQFVKLTGTKPIVFIDYLQILKPYDIKMTDKQNTDTAVKLLKQLARDEQIAIVAVSSLNRENYNMPIGMTAFKESGAIEYSSDILIGLQLNGTGKKDFDVNEAKRKDPRTVELHILKNRNGPMAKPILYSYYPVFNYWVEIGAIEPVASEEEKTKRDSGEKKAKAKS